MRRLFAFVVVGVGVGVAFDAAADVVHFVNGDRLTGTLVEAPSGAVAIDVPHVGVVTVPEAQVASVEGERVPGSAATAEAGTEKTTLVGRLADWNLRSDLGVVVATGNTRTEDINLVVGANRESERFDNIFGLAVRKAEGRSSGGQVAKTKDQLDFDYDLRWKYEDVWYAVANFEFFRDPIKEINQRYTAGIGVGRTFWESPLGALNSDAGVSQVFEEIDTGGMIGRSHDPALRWSLTANRWLLAERLEWYHNSQLLHILASDRGSVWDSDSGILLHVNKWRVGLRFDLQYETEPPAGRGKTDASYAITFGVQL